MNWTKVKLILIIFLAVLNIYLFAKLTQVYDMSAYLPDTLLEKASENLAQRGIYILPDTIDNRHYTKDIYICTTGMLTADRLATQDSSNYLENAFSSLYGDDGYTVRYFDIPDGVSATVANPDGSVFGVAVLSDGFGIEYYMPGIDTEVMSGELASDIDITQTASAPSKVKKVISNFFEDVYSTSPIGYSISRTSALDGGYLVTCQLTLDSIPLCDMSLSFFVNDGKINYIKGTLPTDKITAEYNNELIDGVNILFRLDEQGEITIINESLVYAAVKYDTESYFFVPSRHFTYKSADGITSHSVYDSIAGTKLK